MENVIPIYKDIDTEERYDRELRAYLQYKIICTPDPVRSDHRSNKIYSLIIIKTAADNEVETAFFYDIARNAEKAIRILDIMYNNAVTPFAAGDVLEDII